MGCPVVLLHGVPMGLSVPLMRLVGDDGRRVQTGHQGSQGCILGITWQSPLTVCPLCFFCVCTTQSHVPAWAMCCQCPVSLYPCVPVSACLCLIYDHVSLHTLGPCVFCVYSHLCEQFYHVCIQMPPVCVCLCDGFLFVCPFVSVPTSLFHEYV